MNARDQAEGLRLLLGRRAPRLLCIASNLDGAGRSTLVVNLAAVLVAQGREVIVVDECSNMGNACELLGLRPRHELAHALRGDRSLASVTLAAAQPALRVLPAARGARMLDDAGACGASARAELGRLLASADYVIVDAAQGSLGGLALPVQGDREVIIAARAGADAITRTYAWMKGLARLRTGLEVRLAVCRAHSVAQAQTVHANLAAVARRHLGLRLELAGIVSEDRALAATARGGGALAALHPRTPAALELRSFAARLDAPRAARLRAVQRVAA